MKKEYNWRTGSYCVYKNFVHLVFVTKYRKGVFTHKMLLCMKDYMKTCCDSMNGELIEFGGESDHVHLMVSMPTKIALCNFAGRLKGYSSYQIRKNFFNEIKHKLWGKSLWSPSYCAVSCGGAPLDLVRAYIEKQRTPPSNKSIRQSIQEKGRKGEKSRVKTSKKRRP